MGMEIEINSLDEMYDLMCYNKIPKRRKHMNIKELAPSNDCYYCIHGYQGDNRLAFKDASQNPCNECGDDRKYFEKRDFNSPFPNDAREYIDK